MLSGVNFALYQKIAQASSNIDRFIQEAMLMKSKLERFPLLEEGTGNHVNILI